MSYSAAGRPDWDAAMLKVGADGVSNIVKLINGQDARNNETLRQILAGYNNANNTGRYGNPYAIGTYGSSIPTSYGLVSGTPAVQVGGNANDNPTSLGTIFAGPTTSEVDGVSVNWNDVLGNLNTPSSLNGLDNNGGGNSWLGNLFTNVGTKLGSGNGQNREAQENQGLMQRTANANNQVVQQQQGLLGDDKTSNKNISQANTANNANFTDAIQSTAPNTASLNSSNITPSGIPSLREYAQLAIKNGVRDPNLIIKSYNSVIAPLEADHKRVELQKAMRTYLTSNDPTEKANAIANIHYYQSKPFGEEERALKEAQINHAIAQTNTEYAKANAYDRGSIGVDGRPRSGGSRGYTGGYTGGYSRTGGYKRTNTTGIKPVSGVNYANAGDNIKKFVTALNTGQKLDEETTQKMTEGIVSGCKGIASNVLASGGTIDDAIRNIKLYLDQEAGDADGFNSARCIPFIRYALGEYANVSEQYVGEVLTRLSGDRFNAGLENYNSNPKAVGKFVETNNEVQYVPKNFNKAEFTAKVAKQQEEEIKRRGEKGGRSTTGLRGYT